MSDVSDVSRRANSAEQPYDLFIIGGGVNGCGIARDAAGRGLSVGLAEMNDIASATSSSSTKLFHGGLRYLEYFEFRLVREALIEREILLQAMPHISWPLRFVLPYSRTMRFEIKTPLSRILAGIFPWMRGRRPAWLIRLGLFLYDHMGGRKILPGTKVIDLAGDESGKPLKDVFHTAFEYSDCWVEDSRLVVLNLRDAYRRGAKIMPRTKLVTATFIEGRWLLTLEDQTSGRQHNLIAATLVNAAGPWVDEVLRNALGRNDIDNIRLVGGSHIVIKRRLPDERSYMFQNADGRVVFAIPYEQDYLLIGTTDNDDVSLHEPLQISDAEIAYLCDVASQYLAETVTPEDVVWHFSGIRPLFNDGASEATEATRDYVITQDHQYSNSLINVFGGKITTYRKLAEEVLTMVDKAANRRTKKWTAGAALPGGDFGATDFEALVAKAQTDFPFAEAQLIRRLPRLYGTQVWALLKDCQQVSDLGRHFGADLYQAEVEFLVQEEWARQAADIVYRRTKLGLRMTAEEIAGLQNYLDDPVSLGDAPVDQGIARLAADVDSAQMA